MKAPPRKRPKNDRNQALLGGIITDPEGRPVVPTYSAKGTRRYAFYETRKDLARPGDPSATLYQQGAFDRQVMTCIADLLGNEHALRRLANVTEAGQLRGLFHNAQRLHARLSQPRDIALAMRSLVVAIGIRIDHLEVTLDPGSLGVEDQSSWTIRIPRPTRKPSREAKIRIDAISLNPAPDQQLVKLLADAFEVQALVITSTHLSLNQLAKQVGRCRKQMAKLLSVSWLSPRIVESISDGTQPKAINRARLLEAELPVDWAEQEALFGLAA